MLDYCPYGLSSAQNMREGVSLSDRNSQPDPMVSTSGLHTVLWPRTKEER